MILDSEPKGAKFFQGDKYLGKGPVYVSRPVTKEDQQRGFFFTQPIVAKWLSGAERRSKGIEVKLRDGQTQTRIFRRPDDAPNELVDIHYGLEVEKLAAMNAQAEHARRQTEFMYLNRPQGGNTSTSPYRDSSLKEGFDNLSTALFGYP